MHENEINYQLNKNDRFIKYNFRLLTSYQLEKRQDNFHKYEFGWTGEILNYQFDLVFTKNFPYELPHIYLHGENNFLSIPHVDKRNFLCVFNSTTTYKTDNIIGLIYRVLKELERILSLRGNNLDDEFLSEFNSYVGRDTSLSVSLYSAQKFDNICIFDVNITHHQGDENREYIIYDNDLKKRADKKKPYMSQKCILLPTNKTLYPNKLPKTNRGLINFITIDDIPKPIFKKIDTNTIFMFSDMISKDKRILWGAISNKKNQNSLKNKKEIFGRINRLKTFLKGLA